MTAYPGIAYPVVQKGGVYFEAQVQLLLLFTVDLLDGPFLELVRRNCDRGFGGECWKKEWKSASRRGMIVRRSNLKVDPDKFQVCLRTPRQRKLSPKYKSVANLPAT